MAWRVPRVASVISLFFLSLLIGTTTVGCGDAFGVCETQIRACNKSTTNRSQSVLIDGMNYGVVEVDECRNFDVAPGSHLVLFRFTNTTTDACSLAAPSVEKCKTAGISCSG